MRLTASGGRDAGSCHDADPLDLAALNVVGDSFEGSLCQDLWLDGLVHHRGFFLAHPVPAWDSRSSLGLLMAVATSSAYLGGWVLTIQANGWSNAREQKKD